MMSCIHTTVCMMTVSYMVSHCHCDTILYCTDLIHSTQLQYCIILYCTWCRQWQVYWLINPFQKRLFINLKSTACTGIPIITHQSWAPQHVKLPFLPFTMLQSGIWHLTTVAMLLQLVLPSLLPKLHPVPVYSIIIVIGFPHIILFCNSASEHNKNKNQPSEYNIMCQNR